jgi:hypothetical protein
MATTAAKKDRKPLDKGVEALNNLTKVQLQEVATSVGLEYSTRITKDQLIKALNESTIGNKTMKQRIEYFAGEY